MFDVVVITSKVLNLLASAAKYCDGLRRWSLAANATNQAADDAQSEKEQADENCNSDPALEELD